MASFKISTLIKTILFLLCFILLVTSAFSFKSMSQAGDSFNEMKVLTQNIRELRRMSAFLIPSEITAAFSARNSWEAFGSLYT
ncbi:Tar ligand binding domain-containing protein [Rahnella bonaserana]|uniref:Tar ligand binding domain-containing protein n=1 Tax=Rahnella bonaserana TaxID=2816248 RepID=UPI003D344E44